MLRAESSNRLFSVEPVLDSASRFTSFYERRATPDRLVRIVRWYASLRRPGEIAFVRRSGRHAGAPTVAAHASGNAGKRSRIAVTVSKGVGKAVVRNLVKRRIKGALDGLSAPGHALRIVIVARPAAASEPFDRLARDVAAVIARLGAV